MLVPWLVGKDQEHCALNKVELRKELLYNTESTVAQCCNISAVVSPKQMLTTALHPEHL